MKKLFFITMLILTAMFWSSCSRKSESKTTVEVIDGVECIHNIDTPINSKRSLSFEEELSIGDEDEAGNIVLFRPGFFLVDDSENIYIIDRQDQVIKIFNSSGEYVKSIGARGQGPGEFQRIEFQSFLPDGRLLVMDYSACRVSFFDVKGNFLNSHHWKTQSLGRLHLTTDKSYIVEEYIQSEDLSDRKVLLKEYDFDGNEIGTLCEVIMSESQIHSSENMWIRINIPHSPKSIFVGDSKNQLLYHCKSDTYLIEVYGTNGNLLRKIDRPYEPVPFTKEDIKNFKKRFEERPNEAVMKLLNSMDFPNVKSVVEEMLVDDEGNLWIRTNEERKEDEKNLTAYDIFNKDGYYDSRVWLDSHPYILLKGKMYRTQPNPETGFSFIKRYKMIWKDE